MKPAPHPLRQKLDDARRAALARPRPDAAPPPPLALTWAEFNALDALVRAAEREEPPT